MSLVPAVHTPCPVPADFDQKGVSRCRHGRLRFWPTGPPGRATPVASTAWRSRFAAADEAHDRFIEAASGEYAFALGTSARYAQETTLFSFFINTLSTIECFYFALYNIGACMNSAMFPSRTEDDLRRVSIPETVRRFKNAYLGDPCEAAVERQRFGGAGRPESVPRFSDAPSTLREGMTLAWLRTVPRSMSERLAR